MENPLPKYLHSLALSAWLALWVSWAAAQGSSEVSFKVWNILWGICMPETRDISAMSQTYRIQSWDTFSGIASARGLNYSDFILYLKEFNPDLDINDVIRVGDEFQILSTEVSQAEIDTHRYALEQRQHIAEIQRLNDIWDYEALREYLSFDITPSLPVNLWVGRSYQTTANMYAQWLRTTSRSALPELESEAVCKHVLSQTLARFIGYNPTGIAEIVRNIMLREDTPAWIIPFILQNEWKYTRKNSLDLRNTFNTNFSSSRNAIIDSKESEYSSWLIRHLEYLRTPEAVWCFIPTLYHGTSYASTALAESQWRDVNSHIFACNWFSYSEVFSTSKYWFSDAIESNFTPVLVEMMKDLWVIWRYQSASDASIIWWLQEIHSYILLQVQLSDQSWITLNFNRNLEITNLHEIDRDDIIWFRTGGNILTDWFQITPHWNERLIEQRLTPDWVIYASHYFNTFHPTSILTAPSELLVSQSEGIVWKYVPKVNILKFFDITGEEVENGSDVRKEYYNNIAQEIYNRNYETLEVWEKSQVDRVYAAHSLGLQILGYHSFNGTDWNPWATNINAWIPFLNIFTDEQISNIESVYVSYISEKRQEYLAQIASVCADGNQIYSPVFYFKYFPGETTSSLWNTLNTYVYSRSPDLGNAMREMLPTQRLPIIREIFWSEVAAGNISAGDDMYINAQSVLDLITQLPWEEFIWQDYMSQLSPSDRDIIHVISNNAQVSQALAYYMIKEWYVPDTWYQFEDWSYQDIVENFISRLKRKDLKRYYSWLSGKWLLESNQNLITWIDESIENGSISDTVSEDLVMYVRDFLDKIPAHWPNSHWDMQQRLTNLLRSEYAFKRWPSNWDIQDILSLILEPNSEFSRILKEYRLRFPKQYAQDIQILREIQDELFLESPSGETVYKLIISLTRLNDSSNRYLIWKIVSTSLSKSLHIENITHICEQLERVWESCTSLSETELNSVYSHSMLTMNKWPNVALSIATENYLLRVFESIQDLYPEIPVPYVEIRQDIWITTKPILNYFEFRNRAEWYINHYTPFANWNEDISHLIWALRTFLESDEDSSQKHYSLLENNYLKDILQRANRNTFPYLWDSERNTISGAWWITDFQKARLSFFAYINDSNIKWFIAEPEQKPTDFLAPFLLFLLYGQTTGAMSSAAISKSIKTLWIWVLNGLKITWKTSKNIVLWRLRRFKKDLEEQRANIKDGKIRRAFEKYVRRFDDLDITNFNDLIDQFIEENSINKTYDNDIISNQDGSPWAQHYMDGFYRIWKDDTWNDFEWIHSFRAGKKYETGLSLTNLPNAIWTKEYEDGQYKTQTLIVGWVITTTLVRVWDLINTKNEESFTLLAAE